MKKIKLTYPFTFEEWKIANPKAIKWCKKISIELKLSKQLKLFQLRGTDLNRKQNGKMN